MELFRQLECADLIERQAEKLDYRVAERGENFSGGERLRLVLVRELLRDTDWILFDEAAANLDLVGRQNFYALLQKLPGNKGVIAIVHDVPENSNWPVLNLTELQKCDMI
jgi:ABC-type transport system involved in cytochrome bd biosynthesis fused ATPase/permease subunit